MRELKSFETERLLIKPSTYEDAPFLIELLNTPKYLQYIANRKVHSIEDARQYIENRVFAQFKDYDYGSYTVFLKDNLKPIGSCGLYRREGKEDADIGFAFLPEYEGKGYAYECASLLMAQARNTFQLKTIVAYTTKDNFSSQKLLKKLGLEFSGYASLPNDQEELMFFKSNLSEKL